VSPDSASARLPGTDVPFMEWSPITTRAPLRWPNGAHVAVAVIVSVEHLEMWPPKGTSITPSAIGYGPYPKTYQIVRVSGPEYGSRVGAFRLLNALDASGIRPMVAMDAGLFEDRARLVEEFLNRGAEFLGHGISLSRALGEELDPADETSQIVTSLDAVQRATGQRPVGWLGAGYGESTRTVEVLSGLGVRYVCDWANDEQPYPMRVREGSMTALPVAVDLDDVMVEEVRCLPAWRWAKLVVDALKRLHQDASAHGRLFILNLHAHVSGQPYRIKYVNEVLSTIARHEGVWLATGREILDWFSQPEAARQ
jgi:allantoinase